MHESVLDTYGVKVIARPGRIRYIMPWRKHTDLKESGVAALLVGVLPCVAASALPLVMYHFMQPKGAFLIPFALSAGVWCSLCVFFTALFGAMAYSAVTKWGRAGVWITHYRVLAAQLCGGEESRIAYASLADVKEIATLCDGDDPKNPATPARLLAMRHNSVSRLLGAYPIELVEALAADMNARLKDLRG